MPKKPRFSDEERALLDAIHDDPHDTGLRVHYASWMDQHDPAYAEFIHYQVQTGAEMTLPRPRPGTLQRWKDEPEPTEIEARIRRRLALGYGPWGRPCSRLASLYAFHLGLPLAEVHWWGVGERGLFEEVLAGCSPRMRFHLCLTDGIVDEETTILERVRTHPILRRTSSISLNSAAGSGSVRQGALRELAAWPQIGRLHFLSLPRSVAPFVRGMFPDQIQCRYQGQDGSSSQPLPVEPTDAAPGVTRRPFRRPCGLWRRASAP